MRSERTQGRADRLPLRRDAFGTRARPSAWRRGDQGRADAEHALGAEGRREASSAVRRLNTSWESGDLGPEATLLIR